jgi:hypothetical protein
MCVVFLQKTIIEDIYTNNWLISSLGVHYLHHGQGHTPQEEDGEENDDERGGD